MSCTAGFPAAPASEPLDAGAIDEAIMFKRRLAVSLAMLLAMPAVQVFAQTTTLVVYSTLEQEYIDGLFVSNFWRSQLSVRWSF